MNTRPFRKAAVPALVLLLASCAGAPEELDEAPFQREAILLEPDIGFPDIEPPVPPIDARPTDALSAAAALRTGFTSALEGHTLLLALTVDAMVNGGDADQARETLADNTFVLADYIEMVHEDGSRQRFFDAWTAYTDAMLAYAEAGPPNRVEKRRARIEVRAAGRAVVSLLVELNPHADRGDLLRAMRRWEAAQLRAIDGLVTGSPNQWGRVRRASRASFVLAADWSRPFDALLERDGDPDDPAARIRAQSVFLLEQYVYLTWLATRHDSAIPALEGNVAAFAAFVGEAYGPNAEQEFHALWDARAMATLDYGAALSTNDEKALQQAQIDLDLANEELAGLLVTLDPAFDPDVIRPALRQLDVAVLQALDGLADPAMNETWWDPAEDVYDDVRQAGMFSQHLATALAVPMAD